MPECPECGSKKVNSTNRFSAGCGAVIFAFVLLLVLGIMGSGKFAIFLFAGMLMVGIISLMLGVFSGGTIMRCNDCSHKWTQG